jgi:hypothetical protein
MKKFHKNFDLYMNSSVIVIKFSFQMRNIMTINSDQDCLYEIPKLFVLKHFDPFTFQEKFQDLYPMHKDLLKKI